MGFYGSSGYKGKNEQAKVGDVFHSGRIQYHLRDGTHYLSCADWRVYMEMIRRNRQEGDEGSYSFLLHDRMTKTVVICLPIGAAPAHSKSVTRHAL